MDHLQKSKVELEHRLMQSIHQLQDQLQKALEGKAAAESQHAHVKVCLTAHEK